MGDYIAYRIIAKIDTDYGKELKRLLDVYLDEDRTKLPYLDEFESWFDRTGQPSEGMPQIYGLVVSLRMCYHYFFVDNMNFQVSDGDMEVPPYDKIITFSDDCATINAYFSYQNGYSLEKVLRNLAEHLILEPGQSVTFAMSQSEFDFVGRSEYDFSGLIDYWIASKSEDSIDVTLAHLVGDIRNLGFEPRTIEPFSSELLNPKLKPSETSALKKDDEFFLRRLPYDLQTEYCRDKIG